MKCIKGKTLFWIFTNVFWLWHQRLVKAAGWWWCHSSQDILTPIVYIWIKFCPLFTFLHLHYITAHIVYAVEFPFSNSNSRGRDITMEQGGNEPIWKCKCRCILVNGQFRKKSSISHFAFLLMGSLENFAFEFTLPVQTLIKSQLNVYQEL